MVVTRISEINDRLTQLIGHASLKSIQHERLINNPHGAFDNYEVAGLDALISINDPLLVTEGGWRKNEIRISITG